MGEGLRISVAIHTQACKYTTYLGNETENDNKNSIDSKDMSTSDPLSELSQYRYIQLETFKDSGEPVATPVWFTVNGKKLSVVTRVQTGKVKRLKKNPNVRVAPCGVRGQLKGRWYIGMASIANKEELDNALTLRKKKYGFRVKLAAILSRTRGQLVGINITLT
jgi:PPOX class probable F420-dependent enzyme